METWGQKLSVGKRDELQRIMGDLKNKKKTKKKKGIITIRGNS